MSAFEVRMHLMPLDATVAIMSYLPKKKARKHLTDEEKRMVGNVHQWTSEAIMRERVGESVFNKVRNVRRNASEICGVS